jgi:hypothetical protein
MPTKPPTAMKVNQKRVIDGAGVRQRQIHRDRRKYCCCNLERQSIQTITHGSQNMFPLDTIGTRHNCRTVGNAPIH